MALYLGVDAGGSHCRAVLISDSAELVGSGRGGAANFRTGSFRAAAAAVQEAVAEALADRDPARVQVAFIGSAGLEDKGSEAEGRQLLGSTVNPAKVILDTDAYAAWAGALRLKPGAVVIAGTGSICLAVDAAGRRYRRGGWGPMFGDEGSAYAIARTAICETLKVLDGRSGDTAFLEAFLAFTGIARSPSDAATARELAVWLYDPGRSSADIARFARLVDSLATQGHERAWQLLSRAGEDLARLTSGLDLPVSTPVSIGGSVLLNSVLTREAFRTSLAASYTFTEPAFSPVTGAALLALKQDRDLTARLLQRLTGQVSGFDL